MSGAQRAGLAVLLVAVVLAWGWWLTKRLAGPPKPTSPVTETPASPSPTGPTMTPLQAPRGYRLAGVAVGDPDSFAVIEAPNGANVLYRVNADVPGLGRVVRIQAERIVVQSDAGEIELWLMPAASPTPTRVRAATARAATAAPRTVSPPVTPAPPTPTPRSAAGG